jgi:hypothetical protein
MSKSKTIPALDIGSDAGRPEGYLTCEELAKIKGVSIRTMTSRMLEARKNGTVEFRAGVLNGHLIHFYK